MSHDHAIDLGAVSESVKARMVRALPGWMRPLFLACLAVGAVTFLYLAIAGDANRAWRIYHLNWLYWTGLSLGGILFAAVTTVAKGRWAVPLRRIGEASAPFLPVSFVLFLLSWIGRARIYPWVAHPITEPHVKAFWLRDWFLYARDGFGLLLLFSLGLWFVYHGVRQDSADYKGRLASRHAGFYDRITRGWNETTGFTTSGEKRAFLAPLYIIAYAVVMSLVAFDQVMSLAPFWVSNLYGGFFFIGAWLSGLMSLALLTLLWRRHFGLDDVITGQHLHDLGKLCFGFTVFWGYTFFAQFLVIWYGNLPEETSFLFLRMMRPEWRPISTAMVFMCFIIPFWGLISIKGKKTPAFLATFATVSLLGLWVDRYVMVVPSIVQSAPDAPLGIFEVLITAGFFGLWGLCYLWFADRFPLVSAALIRHQGERRAHAHQST